MQRIKDMSINCSIQVSNDGSDHRKVVYLHIVSEDFMSNETKNTELIITMDEFDGVIQSLIDARDEAKAVFAKFEVKNSLKQLN